MRQRSDGSTIRQPSGSMSRRAFLGAAAGSALLGAAGSLVSQSPQAGARNVRRSVRLLASGPPPITVDVQPNGTAPGDILLTPMNLQADYQTGPMIVDNSGKVIWFHPLSKASSNLQVQTYKNQPVLTWWQGQFESLGYGLGNYKIYNTSYQEVATVKAADGLHGDLHDFVISPEGTALFTVYRVIPYDLSPVGGPVNGQLLESIFQEVDIATGKLLMKWRATRHVHLRESHAPLPSTASTPWDWFHINSVAFDGDGDIIVSSRHTWTVYKIDRSTGKIVWRLNGKRSDFQMGPGTRFFWQHHARHHPNNVLTVFDDGAGPTQNEQQSRGLKLRVDTTNMTVQLIEQYLPQPTLLTSFAGSAQLLPNGNVFVGWGGNSHFSEYTPNGKLIYQAELPSGVVSYRAFRSQWPGMPMGQAA